MKAIAAAFVFFVTSFAGAAFAQSPEAPPPPATAPTSAPLTPQSLAAARDLLQSMVIDSGVLPHATEAAFANLKPQMIANVEAAPYFVTLTSPHQQALLAYLDTLPAIALEEMNRVIPAIFDDMAPRTAAIFTETQMRDIAAFIRTPAGRAEILRGADQAVNHSAQASTPEEAAAMAAFDASPSGQAANANSAAFSALLQQSMVSAFQGMQPSMQSRIQNQMCTIMEDECPPALRAVQAK